MNLQELTDFCDYIRQKGVRGCELLVTDSVSHSIAIKDGELGDETESSVSALAVRVWLEGGKMGRATGAPVDAKKLVKRALASAAKAQKDAFSGPVGRLQGPNRGLDIDDKRYPQLTREDRADLLQTADRSVGGVNSMMRCEGFSYEDSRTRRVFVNSKGVCLESVGTRFFLKGTVRVGASGMVLSERMAGRAFSTVASLPYGVLMARRLNSLLGDPFELPKAALRVMMTPRVTAQIFARVAEGMAHGDRVGDSTFLGQDRAAGITLHPKVHMLDDGALTGGLNTRAFDGRGVPPVPVVLIREGEVAEHYLDVNTARREGRVPTGHVIDAALRPSNLILRTGTRSINAILAERGEEVFVLDHLNGLDEGFDFATGKITCVGSGFVKHGSATVGIVREVTLQANLLNVLSQVLELASDTDRHEHVDAPGMLVDGFSLV